MGFEDEEADTEPRRPRPPKKQPEPVVNDEADVKDSTEVELEIDPHLPPDPVTREVPKRSAALIIHDPGGDGQVRLEVLYPEGTADDNVPLSARIAQHAMEYITRLSQEAE